MPVCVRKTRGRGKRQVSDTVLKRDGGGGAHVPWIGSIFCSFARSFIASSHSLVMVLGGGGAADMQSGGEKRGKGRNEHDQAPEQDGSTAGERTGRADRGVKDASGEDEPGHAQDDLGDRARGVNGRPGAVRAKGDVVRCKAGASPRSARRARGRGRKKASHAPAFFSSRERPFQSFFWSSSSCWWIASCSSADRRVHIASTFERGTTVAPDDDDVDAAGAACAAAANARAGVRRGRRGRARRRACMRGSGVGLGESEEDERKERRSWARCVDEETVFGARGWRHEKEPLDWPAGFLRRPSECSAQSDLAEFQRPASDLSLTSPPVST